MRILVTGARGFVGPYLFSSLRNMMGIDAAIFPTSRQAGLHPTMGYVDTLDVTNREAVLSTIRKINPTHVVHLAGVAAIPAAMANVGATWQIHLGGTLNIADAIIEAAPECWLIHVSSGQVYGSSARSGKALAEDTVLEPTNVYTASKAAADLALGALTSNGLKSIRFRPFNHTGPQQSEDFVVPSFAKQIARIAIDKNTSEIRVGNLDIERDFLDVRDVVSAYAKAVISSDTLPSGLILNIASGIPYRIGDVLEKLIKISGETISVRTDKGRSRARDISRFVGDSTLARRVLRWSPTCSFEETLREMYEHALRDTTLNSVL